MGLPVTGGLTDSTIGIVLGAVNGVSPRLGALLGGLGVPV